MAAADLYTSKRAAALSAMDIRARWSTPQAETNVLSYLSIGSEAPRHRMPVTRKQPCHSCRHHRNTAWSGHATEIAKPVSSVGCSDQHQAVGSEMAGVTAQMSRAYSAMVRSEESLPQLAVLSTAIFIHRSWSCRITSVTSHPQMGSGAHNQTAQILLGPNEAITVGRVGRRTRKASPTRSWHLTYSSKSGSTQK